MITLVPFYKEVKKDAQQIEEMKQVFDYKNALYLLKESFEKFNSEQNKHFVLATDNDTEIDSNVKCFRSDLSNMNIMESLTVSNTNYVINNSGKMVLCGVDHLICNNIEMFYDDDFDIGLFVRWDQINNTVVLVNKTKSNKKHINNFFKKRLECFYNLDSDTKNWFGDQRSYSNLLQEENILTRYNENPNITMYDGFGLKIKLFNYGKYVKPIKTGGGIKYNPTNILLDFKGPQRKKHFNDVYKKIMENK